MKLRHTILGWLQIDFKTLCFIFDVLQAEVPIPVIYKGFSIIVNTSESDLQQHIK